MNPYREALAWIAQSPDGATAVGLAKLILSLSASECSFSLAECLRPVTGPHLHLAMRVIHAYVQQASNEISEAAELEVVAMEVRRLYPRLVQLGGAMTAAARQQALLWL